MDFWKEVLQIFGDTLAFTLGAFSRSKIPWKPFWESGSSLNYSFVVPRSMKLAWNPCLISFSKLLHRRGILFSNLWSKFWGIVAFVVNLNGTNWCGISFQTVARHFLNIQVHSWSFTEVGQARHDICHIFFTRAFQTNMKIYPQRSHFWHFYPKRCVIDPLSC